jgi:hypothetical protein
MSIISDFKANFSSDNPDSQDFIITEYQKPDSDVYISMYGVFEFGYNKTNAVAVRPLEQSQFNVDSKQIKPSVISVKGIFLPDAIDEALITSYGDLTDFVTAQFNYCRAYQDGIQLFSITNTMYGFGVYEPLTLTGLQFASTTESPIPDVVLTFTEVQSSTATAYSTVKTTPQTREPQNKPSI